jgi:hypothetical protein
MTGTTWRPQEAVTTIHQFEYGQPILLQDCLNSLIKRFEGTHEGYITCLDFSPGDSNLLASGDAGSNIKLWNFEQEVCVYSSDHSFGFIPSLSLSFPVEDEGHTCIFVTSTGSLIRTHWGNDLSDVESHIVDMSGLDGLKTSAFSHCGSLLAAAAPDDNIVTLYDMRTMTVLRKLSIPQNTLGPYDCLAFSPDGKTVVLRFNTNEIHICEVSDLHIRRVLQSDALEYSPIGALSGLSHLIPVASSFLRLVGIETFDFGFFSCLGVAYHYLVCKILTKRRSG